MSSSRGQSNMGQSKSVRLHSYCKSASSEAEEVIKEAIASLEGERGMIPASMTFVSAGAFNFGNGGSEPLFHPRQPGDTIEYKIGAYSRPESRSQQKSPSVDASQAESTQQSGSEIESLMQELKKKHERREQIKSEKATKTSSNSIAGASSKMQVTSNIRLGNLAPHVTPQLLTTEFACYGPILSTKVMVPRAEERSDRKTCGFVLFAHRSDAERAKSERDGSLFHGSTLAMDWAPAPDPQSLARMMRDLHSSLHLSSSAQSVLTQRSSSSQTGPSKNAIPKHAEIVYVVPPESSIRREIDSFADYVVTCGPEVEETTKRTCPDDPKYNFLFNSSSADHVYYKWRLESFHRGDTLLHWNTRPLQLSPPNGPFYIPPPSPQSTGSSFEQVKPFSTDESDEGPLNHPPSTTFMDYIPPHLAKEGEPLTLEDRNTLETTLRTLSASRASIRSAMEWCIDHDSNAPEIVQILTESLAITETKLAVKLGRMFLVSDILHNAKQMSLAAPTYRPHLWLYAASFYATLPKVLQSFGLKHQALPGRISAQTLKDHIQHVLNGWKKQQVFMPSYIDSLLVAFNNPHPDDKLPTSLNSPLPPHSVPLTTPTTSLSSTLHPNITDQGARMGNPKNESGSAATQPVSHIESKASPSSGQNSVDGYPIKEFGGLPIDFEALIEEEVSRIRKRRSSSPYPSSMEGAAKKQKL